MSRSKTSPSSLQRFMNTQKTFKRNKNLFNISSLNSIQHEEQIIRRIPKIHDHQIDLKITTSFQSSIVIQSDKLQHDIQKFKQRMKSTMPSTPQTRSIFYIDNFNNTSHNNSFFNQSNYHNENKNQERQKTIKMKCVVSMNKMLSRQNSQKLSKKYTENCDQRLFNNFKEFQFDLDHTPDFKKYLKRPQSAKVKSYKNDSYPSQNCSIELSQKYCKYAYKSINMKCLFDYKTQKKQNGRVYSIQKKPGQLPDQIDRDLVLKAELATQKAKKQVNFFRQLGRQVPSSIQKKSLQVNTNYYAYKAQQNQSQMIKKQYFARVKKQLIQKRISQIRNRKKAGKFKQHQVCDIKYFRLNQSQRC